jgi:phosphoribosylformylglycinamidine synthase
MRDATFERLLRSAHDVSDGGLGIAIAESLFGALGETMGAVVAIETPRRADGVLFSETQSRILVSVAPGSVDALTALADEHGVPISRIGVTGGERLDVHVNGVSAISQNVATLRQTWWTAIERGLTS